jgi:hypothetical protein
MKTTSAKNTELEMQLVQVLEKGRGSERVKRMKLRRVFSATQRK